MLFINSTFETNRLGLILFVVVGITNIRKNFFAIYNFAKFEAWVLFDFIFDFLKRFILIDNIAET